MVYVFFYTMHCACEYEHYKLQHYHPFFFINFFLISSIHVMLVRVGLDNLYRLAFYQVIVVK